MFFLSFIRPSIKRYQTGNQHHQINLANHCLHDCQGPYYVVRWYYVTIP